MTNEIIQQAKGMIGEGYDLNQVSAILMIDKIALAKAIAEPVKKTKVETPEKPELPGAEFNATGWMNEEGL